MTELKVTFTETEESRALAKKAWEEAGKELRKVTQDVLNASATNVLADKNPAQYIQSWYENRRD